MTVWSNQLQSRRQVNSRTSSRGLAIQSGQMDLIEYRGRDDQVRQCSRVSGTAEVQPLTRILVDCASTYRV